MSFYTVFTEMIDEHFSEFVGSYLDFEREVSS